MSAHYIILITLIEAINCYEKNKWGELRKFQFPSWWIIFKCSAVPCGYEKKTYLTC